MNTTDRTIPRETIERMMRTIEPNCALREFELAEGGYLPVYHLVVETRGGTRECVLKASPDEHGHGIDTEARLLEIIRTRSSIPVPEVWGAVDEHDELPAPFFLMKAMPGRAVRRTETGNLPEETIERIARSMGEHLAQLHGIDCVDAFGLVEPSASHTICADRPSASVEQIRVADPEESWPAYLRQSVAGPLEHLSSGRFGDLVPDVRRAVAERINELSGPFRPALCHVDGSLENLLFDSETATVTAVLDWAFTIAGTPAYDLVFVEHSLSGGPWWFVPDVPDYKPLVREALIEGYRTNGRKRVIEQFRAHHDCYRLLSCIHSLVHFEDRLDLDGATAAQVDGAARRHREVLDELC